MIDIFGHQDYPTPVKKVLGELVAATSALGATIKFNGAFIRQVKGVRLAMEEEKGSCGLSAGGLLLLPEVMWLIISKLIFSIRTIASVFKLTTWFVGLQEKSR